MLHNKKKKAMFLYANNFDGWNKLKLSRIKCMVTIRVFNSTSGGVANYYYSYKKFPHFSYIVETFYYLK